MYATKGFLRIGATRAEIYAALTDPESIACWRAPTGMHGAVTGGDPDGTWFRITLTREMPGPERKSSELTDTYVSRFVQRVPDTLVVERIEFESSDPALRRPMTMTTTLVDVDGATDVTVVHEGVPDEIPRADNEVGTRMALANLARFLNSG